MKLLHLLPVVISFVILASVMQLNQVRGENVGDVGIKNIQALPRVIIEGHLFKVNATLVNNSPNPILVENGACDAPFSVTFDKHALVRKNEIYCTLQLLVHRIDPGNQMTFTSPYSALSYVAQSGGPVNATITFPYKMWNPQNQSYVPQSLSESFSFTIWNRTKVPVLSPSENQTIVDTALAIPGLQEWSHDWRFVDMGFLGNNKLGTPYYKYQYAILNLKAPSSSAPFPCNNDWWAWVDIDMDTMKVVQATYPTMESHNCQVATGGGPGTLGSVPSSNKTSIESPLGQFRAGTAAGNVKCNDGLQLVTKSEDGSPACVKPDTAQKLIELGWAKEVNGNSSQIANHGPPSKPFGPRIPVLHTNSIRDTSFINLSLATNSTAIRHGQTVGVDIWISNTSGNKLTMNYDDNWPWKRLTLHPCVVGMPFGVALLEGDYSLQNLTAAKQLSLYQNGTYNCPMERYDQVNAYVFEPSSDNATLETPNGNFTSEIRQGIPVNGFYDHSNNFQILADGQYTIVAGDEWGHIALQHFTVSNSIQDVAVASIKMIPPFTPGGPVIQLTLENVGAKPITNIKAVLELDNNYTFDFTNVTSSSPLIPGNYASNATMLIGGGFESEVAYPLAISGMEGNASFVYPMKVQIQG